jgi:hypothetical protein
MFRQVFIPTEPQYIAPIPIPQEWYGREMELSVVPVTKNKATETEDEKLAKMREDYETLMKKLGLDYDDFEGYRKRRERLERVLAKYPPLHLAGYKFNRDEANDYD